MNRLCLSCLTILLTGDGAAWGFVTRPSSLSSRTERNAVARGGIARKASYNDWNPNYGGPPPPYPNDPYFHEGPYFENPYDDEDPRGRRMSGPGRRPPLQQRQQGPWRRQPPPPYGDDGPGFHPPPGDDLGPYPDGRVVPQRGMPPPPNQRPLDSNYQQMNSRRDPTGSLGKPMGPSFGDRREDPRDEAIGPKEGGGGRRRVDPSFPARRSDARGPPRSFYGSPPPPQQQMDPRDDPRGRVMRRQPFGEDGGYYNNDDNYYNNERSFRPDTSLNSNEAPPSGASLFNPPPDPARRRPNQRPLDSNYERVRSRQDPVGSLGDPMGPAFADQRVDPRETVVGPRGGQRDNRYGRAGDDFNQPPPPSFNMRPPDGRQTPGSFYGSPPPPMGQRPPPGQGSPYVNDGGAGPGFNDGRTFRPDSSLNANEAYRSAASYNPASAYQPRSPRTLGDPMGPRFGGDRDQQREVVVGPAGAGVGSKRASSSPWGRGIGDPIGASFADDKDQREVVIGPTNERGGGTGGPQAPPGYNYGSSPMGPSFDRDNSPRGGGVGAGSEQQSFTYRPAEDARPPRSGYGSPSQQEYGQRRSPDAFYNNDEDNVERPNRSDGYATNNESYRSGASTFNPTREFTPRQARKPLDSNYQPTKSRMDPIRSLGDPLGASFADVREDPREILVGPKAPEKSPNRQSASSFQSDDAPGYRAQGPGGFHQESYSSSGDSASYEQMDRSADGREETYYSESVYNGAPNQPFPSNTPESGTAQNGPTDYSFYGGSPGARTGMNQHGVSPPFPTSAPDYGQGQGPSAPQASQAPAQTTQSYYGGTAPYPGGPPRGWQGDTMGVANGAEEDGVAVSAEVINEAGVSPPFPSHSSGYNPTPSNAGAATGHRSESVYGGAGVGARDSVRQTGVSPQMPKVQTFISEEEAEQRAAEGRKNETALEYNHPTDPSLAPTGESDDRDREFLWYHEKTYTVRYK